MLAALALLALAVPSGAVEDCRKCGDLGVLACPSCAKDPCESERGYLFCSVAAECPDCRGTGLVPCERCEAEPEQDLDAQAALVSAWLETVRAVDGFMEKDLHHAESAHFVLTWDVPRIDLKRAGEPHPAMHVYLDRLEDLWQAFGSDLGADDGDFRAKTRVMIWSRQGDQERASLHYTLQTSSTESKLMGAAPVVSIFYDKGYLHEDSELHQAVVHQTVHCLLSNVYDGIWPGNIGGGWIDEGLAHWYETELFGGVRHYCYVESDSIRSFKFGRWEPEVRIAVDRDEQLGLLSVTGRNTVDMTPEERMFAWSYVDFLLRARPGSIGPLARSVKQKQSLKTALQESLGVTPFELEQQWKEWVVSTYSPKKRKR